MTRTTKGTLELSAKLWEHMKSHTDNTSHCVAEATERAERRRLLREDLNRYQEEFGAFTEDEMTEASALLHGDGGRGA